MQTTVREVTGTVSQSSPGRIKVRIIDEGQGSTGFYSAAVLEQAAQDRAFSRGTQMHLDHSTAADTMERPEGSLRNLVGVLTEDARYEDGALIAEARVGSQWRSFIDDFGEFIGVSISAVAEVSESENGRVIERIIPDPFNRADFVTVAGRGGRVEAVLEAAQRIQEQNPPPVPAGAPREEEEAIMADTNITEALNRAEEANSRAAALEATNKELAAERDQLAAENKTLREAAEKAALEARQEQARNAVREAFGKDAPAFYLAAADRAAESADYDHAAFTEQVTEAAAVAAQDAGTPNLGGGSTATESKTVTSEDILAELGEKA
ncbi:hypothetical protein [Citricoccus sp. NR2]|uniref:hypothetical protein n=1 Tax=Citricoccus sp. NR2 TaxID=3004095 RepID=UPI0022DD90CF|nr:hypothetical protein [Citricoccus sp. NR2]WBL18511.1 hypothetical protein O1A05_12190 [Citricoccus sp. NR2]